MNKMIFKLVLFIFCLSLTSAVVAKPHPEAASRAETEHFADDPQRHDVEFDHNAFLGKDVAEEFAKLTPDESVDRLKSIILKIDVNHDDKITEDELKVWIKHVADKSVRESTERQWKEINPEGQPAVKWEEYSVRSYGPEEERLKDVANLAAYKDAIRHDRRRWEAADVNKDNSLTRDEFTDFVHPEDKEHMRDAVIDELLESVDTDKDGNVSEQEYLNDLARAYQTPLNPGEPEPDWVERERDQFRRYRDLNKDGKMDRQEVGEWIMPANYDPIDAEAKHLIYHADENRDGLLTQAEIIKKKDIFVSSQATNYGNVLREHEEL